MTDAKKIRVALYPRVSSDEQRENQTIRTQVDILQRWAEQNCELIEVVGWFNDDGVTGTLPFEKRPEGKKIISLAQAGLLDEVVVTRLDRLGRASLVLLNIKELLASLSVSIYAVLESVDDPFDYELKSVLAADERRRFLKRSKEGMDRAAREGRYMGGIVPLGYVVEGKKPNARLAVSDKIIWETWTEADVARQMFRWSGVDGWSTIRIADHLNALGVPTAYTKDQRLLRDDKGRRTRRTDNIWRPGRIRSLLVNETYKGRYLYGRNSKKQRELIPSKVPALVSEELWQAAQETLAANRLITKHGIHVNLLRSLARCTLCGLTFCAYKGSDQVYYYRCGGQMKYRGKNKAEVMVCPSRSFRADFLESIVKNDVLRWLQCPDDGLVEELRLEQAAPSPSEAVADAERWMIEQALRASPGKRDRLLEARMSDLVTLEQLQEKLDKLKDEENKLRSRLGELQPETEEASSPPPDEDLVLEIRRRVDEGFDDVTWREVIALLVSRIDVATEVQADGKKKQTITIRYRFPGVVSSDTGTGSERQSA